MPLGRLSHRYKSPCSTKLRLITAKGPRKLFPDAFIIPRAQSNLVLPIGFATGKTISIQRMFKSGLMEEGLVRASEEGVPQGSILSPLLSNVYLHYVLDLWFSRRFRKHCQGQAYYFRFADDCAPGNVHLR